MKNQAQYIILLFLFIVFGTSANWAYGQHEEENHPQTTHDQHGDGDGGDACSHTEHHGPFDPAATAFHHIANANVFSIGPYNFPLPCILYVPGEGLHFFSSSRFKFDFRGHGDGHYAYKGFVLDGGSVKRVKDSSFPKESVEVGGFAHEEDSSYVCYENQTYVIESKSTMDGGLFGGGMTSFYDFSLSKNVVAMILVFLLLSWAFVNVARAYSTREGKAPSGLQAFLEPMFLFIQDEVAKPFLGHKWATYQPLLMALFFFILGLNLFGQIPFFGGANVTGNLAVTMALALIVFLVTNISGKKPYWEHIVWMPGVPHWVKVIITPVEILGLFIKPLTLMLRLFANITAGHIVVLIFISLIFIFGKSGESLGGTALGFGLSVPLTLFMMAIELLVAFIQAFVFTILTASYIGAATEESHH